jgi:hypothetical protein
LAAATGPVAVVPEASVESGALVASAVPAVLAELGGSVV